MSMGVFMYSKYWIQILLICRLRITDFDVSEGVTFIEARRGKESSEQVTLNRILREKQKNCPPPKEDEEEEKEGIENAVVENTKSPVKSRQSKSPKSPKPPSIKR